jgi:hypothetical protein
MNDEEHHKLLKAHASYILHHDYPCMSCASMFEFKVLTMLEDINADYGLYFKVLECMSKMSDGTVAKEVTDRLKKILNREKVEIPDCDVCNSPEYIEWKRGLGL